MYRNIIVLILLSLGIVSCDKESYQSSLPYARVNFSCDMVYAPYSFIQGFSQYLTVNRSINGTLTVTYPGQPSITENKQSIVYVGFGGLIIGHSTNESYYAFDLACPVEANTKTLLNLSENGLGKAVCPKCGTMYDLNGGGFPEKGVGKQRLATYKVVVNGTRLQVTN